MKITLRILHIIILLLFFLIINAQDKTSVKFGKISPEDFDLSKYSFDTSVSAVVIADIGSSEFKGNSKGWFSLVYKHSRRIKILKKSGFDAANINIPLYSNGNNEEKVANLQAITYNLENGTVVKSELEDKSIFKDKLSENLIEKKFTFPAVKEGSIIEFSYTVNSDFLFNLQPWTFQGIYPRLWSEYTVNMPEFFGYVTLSQGYQPYFIKKQSQSFQSYNLVFPGGTLTDTYARVSGQVTDFRWVMKDIPALKEEGFTSTINNHIAKIEFQLSQYRFPDVPVEDVMGNWNTVSEKMLKREDFGLDINKNNSWLNDDMKRIVAGTSNTLQKATLIYTYVRDNFTCTDFSDVFLNNSLKTIFKNKNGSVSDINLLLIAMLHHENIEAYPVILSTRDHGFANMLYPLMSSYNYVIAEIRINGIPYYLDASQPLIGFGKLPLECYNGYARRIAQDPQLITFATDSLKETKLTTVFINSDSGKIEGSFKSTLGYYESLDVRKKIKEKGEPGFLKNLKSTYPNDIEIIQQGIDSLKITEKPLVIHYDFKLNNMDENIIYFNPMMGEGYKNNFLKAAVRRYPVEMPYTFDETYVFNMVIPPNYIVEEIPKSAKVSFNDGEGFFEYLINKSETLVQLRSRVIMKRANFAPDEYNSLRDFFGYIVKKQSEQIVFKKKLK